MPAGALQIRAQPGGRQDVGQTGVSGTRAADRAGGEQWEPVGGGQSAEDVGDGGVGGAAVEGELDGERVGSDEVDESAQDGVGGVAVPGGRTARVAEGPAQGTVGGAGQDQAGACGTRGSAGAAQCGGELGETMSGVGAVTGAEVVMGHGGAQTAVADRIAGQDGQAGAAFQGELGTVDSGKTVGATGLGVLDDAGQPVVIGQGERLQAQLDGGGDEVLRLIGAVEEGVGGVGVELGVAVGEDASRIHDVAGRGAAPPFIEHAYTLRRVRRTDHPDAGRSRGRATAPRGVARRMPFIARACLPLRR